MSDGDVRMVFFFFQAEDGIRDWSVTGVQTCALPISSGWKSTRRCSRSCGRREEGSAMVIDEGKLREFVGKAVGDRSEERRVGKECRSRWRPSESKKQTGVATRAPSHNKDSSRDTHR